jgi:hypothetical protein
MIETPQTLTQPRDFKKDLAASEKPELREVFVRELYPKLFPCSRPALYKDDKEFQQAGSDVIIDVRKAEKLLSRWLCEEKIRSPKYWKYRGQDLLLELTSNVELGYAGWALTSEADLLVYVWDNLPELQVFACPMQPLVSWFALNHTRYETRSASTGYGSGAYHTTNARIPFADPLFCAFREAHGARMLIRDTTGAWCEGF